VTRWDITVTRWDITVTRWNITVTRWNITVTRWHALGLRAREFAKHGQSVRFKRPGVGCGGKSTFCWKYERQRTKVFVSGAYSVSADHESHRKRNPVAVARSSDLEIHHGFNV
jgi:hypothetical protein